MVGLSVVLETQNQKCGISHNNVHQVINKTTFILNKPSSSSSSSSFLDQCFLCRKRLSPGKDIYMYKGDRGFCSVECRCKQIFMDEEESIQKDVCSLAAIKKPTSPATPSSSSSAAAARHRHRKGPSRNRAGGFAY